MDIQQLKLMAGRVRGLLEQSKHTIGHNQSLDLIAALPGLRNWPEVQAFPDRVAACELDAASAGRLGFRLKRKFDLNLTPQAILGHLSPSASTNTALAPQIWPTGPQPGIYVTDSQEAIDALLANYEDATDGALIYAERAGNHWEGSIDLGEGGLWSSGLWRVPSGTLLVVGPLLFDQQSWNSTRDRLEMACLIAQGAGHRVAVLIDTPTPEAMFEDVRLIVRSAQPEGEDYEAALLGSVSAEGALQLRQPFATSRPVLAQVPNVATPDAIPASVRNQLANALAGKTSGLLLFGSSEIEEHSAIELVAASLAMTEHAGPAARIMPRHRPTPAKDWLVPQAIQQLPFLPSIESAYAQGYRRMIVSPHYTRAELMKQFSGDVLFISGTYGSVVDDVFMRFFVAGSLKREEDLLSSVLAILGVAYAHGSHGRESICDLYLPDRAKVVVPAKDDDLTQFIQDGRVVRWQDELVQLLGEGRLTRSAVQTALKRNRHVADFLSSLS